MQASFYKRNREKYFSKVEDKSLSLFYSGYAYPKSADQNFNFEVEKNFYYLTGINQANVILALVKDGNINRSYLFIEQNDPVLVKWDGKKLDPEEAEAISGCDMIGFISKFDDFVFSAFNSSRRASGSLKHLYLNLERKNSKEYSNFALDFSKDFIKKYPEVNVKNSYPVVIELRMFKEAEEVEAIQKAIEITKGGLNSIMSNLQPGLYENQMEAHFDYYLKYNNNTDTAFATIAASGKNGTILHYGNNNSRLEANELVLFDLGARLNFYISDISRTYPISGKFTKRQKEVYEEVLNVNKETIKILKPGITWGEFNSFAKDLIAKACIKLGLIKDSADVGKYYYHSIGHSIGLDTHDPANHDIKISEGMVVTVEPGIYIEEEKIGIRIEDNILITKDGYVNLSKDIIKEVKDIEKFMAAK